MENAKVDKRPAEDYQEEKKMKKNKLEEERGEKRREQEAQKEAKKVRMLEERGEKRREAGEDRDDEQDVEMKENQDGVGKKARTMLNRIGTRASRHDGNI